MVSMAVSQRGRDLIRGWEGLRLAPYHDAGGKLSIGIGHLITTTEEATHTVTISGRAVDYLPGLTEAQCWALLGQDLSGAEQAVNSGVTAPLNQNQFDALVSFTFNVGGSAFAQSTLRQLLNEGRYDRVPGQLRLWIRVHGQINGGLVARREKEIELWETLAC